jgi:predicted transposase/invertase (TIGR01784 family)
LEKNATEVLNMLLEEWNWEEAEALMREESREEGREEGREMGRLETARNALTKGLSLDVISEITGYDIDTIKTLSPV